MISKEVVHYIEELIQDRNELLVEMEHYAKEANVPIMELVGIEAMLQMLKLYKPKRIIEIGTAIGYSAIRMAEAVEDCMVVTIERDEERYEKAIEYINRANLSHRIRVIYGDAFEVSKELDDEPPFDVLFIDAAKGQYKRFFEEYGKLIPSGGVIISDNILFRGLVANSEHEQKRLKTLANKLNQYNQWLMTHEQYGTTIFPVGDGIAVSIKK
ncbi:O-methyltransferase [Bacillus sp. FJAT-45350]|uniref:O-methyltransferase n=1 Tax=Bacillus sp. FJAT-45350 TaxID=2011014 RepID=UPI000BB9539F|nr:O-methyltransferase [Bacillus sp. FJAT-45350]